AGLRLFPGSQGRGLRLGRKHARQVAIRSTGLPAGGADVLSSVRRAGPRRRDCLSARPREIGNGASRRMTPEAAKRRFREIVPPHLDDAYRLAKWISGNGADAEDIVQEASMRALAALESTTPLKARAWWLSIVRNTALTWMQRHRPRTDPLVGDDGEAFDIADACPDPEAALIARDEGERVRRAIASLPLPLRETLVLREFEDLDYREIAQATQAPIGTVMSRLSRARDALAKMLRKTP